MNKHIFVLFNLVTAYFKLSAQNEVIVFKHKINLKIDSIYILNFNEPLNGLTIQASENYNFSDLKLVLENKDTIAFLKDEHLGINQTNLILFDSNKYFQFFSKTDVELTLFFQYVPKIVINNLPLQNSKRSNCQMPTNIIPQQIWRQGLNAPTPGREATKTHHCIIHHAASNNSQSDYTQLVRSFYVQHTQVNGWDDIAYNYLIAPNGNIYAGRDPEKANIKQDNVLGAHFCGKNANTMGICLIGDYEIINPSDTMIGKLIELLTWKYVKDTLNPSYTFKHPYNTGALLSALAGHKQGCATTCPGTYVFSKLDSLRNIFYLKFKQCLPTVSISQQISIVQNEIYPNPLNGILIINTELIEIKKPIIVYSTEGKKNTFLNTVEIKLNNGIYMIEYTTTGGIKRMQKLVVY